MIHLEAAALDYSRAGPTWQDGPGRVYDQLAERIVADTPVDWRGRIVLDLGAGTGAASRAIVRAGGRPVATDVAVGMLAAAVPRPPSVLADARALPFRASSLDGCVSAFCLNHLDDPAAALAGAAVVVRPGGPLVVSAYAADDGHPVKAAVEQAAAELGWAPPPWAPAVKEVSVPLATVAGAASVAAAAGLTRATVERIAVAFPELTGPDLVAWRMGMAQLAPFVDDLDDAQRGDLAARALEILGDAPPLVRRVIVLRAVV